MTGNQKQNSIPCRLKHRVSPFGVCSGRCAATIPLRHAACQLRTAVGQHGLVGYKVIPVQTPNFGHYAAITSGFKSFLMIALWYSLGGLSLRLP